MTIEIPTNYRGEDAMVILRMNNDRYAIFYQEDYKKNIERLVRMTQGHRDIGDRLGKISFLGVNLDAYLAIDNALREEQNRSEVLDWSKINHEYILEVLRGSGK